jgi:group II intron reverse transcriptase/maturase
MRSPTVVLDNLASKDVDYEFHRLYRNLFNEDFYLTAYSRMYHKPGNMTQGTDGKTIDGMSINRIRNLINRLKDESYQPNPVRRHYIEKKSGGTRPLGIPSFDDKLVQEVIRSILEAIYEKGFHKKSHGFRPNRSCHTALLEIRATFTGARWWVEGDIKGFFDNIDHHTLINTLRRKVKDERFINLIWKFLRAGYLEDWVYNSSYSGTPQGGIISPILSNIYLNELDRYMDKYKKEFDKGKQRKLNNSYTALQLRQNRARKKYRANWIVMSDKEKQTAIQHLRDLAYQLRNTPCTNDMDESFKRIQYVRYADDFLIGIIGSKADAIKVKADLTVFLKEQLKLDLSHEKTLITNSRDKASFLGYDIQIRRSQELKRDKNGTKVRKFNNSVNLLMPKQKWINKLFDLGVIKIGSDGKTWKSIHRSQLIRLDDLEIMYTYSNEIRGLYNYYRLAENVCSLNDFGFQMYQSMLKTYANKYKTKTSKIRKKFSFDGKFAIPVKNKDSGLTELRFFIDLKFPRDLVGIANPNVDDEFNRMVYVGRTSLIDRMQARKCEYCGAEDTDIEIHHVRKLKDLKHKASKMPWEWLMIARNRKTSGMQDLPCRHTRWKIRLTNGEPYTSRDVRTVRGGVLGNLSPKDDKALGAYPTM